MKQIYDFIRGLSPYPAAWTELYMGGAGKQMMKIYEAEKIFCQHDMQIGEIRTDLKTDFRIAVKMVSLIYCLCSWQERNVCMLRIS